MKTIKISDDAYEWFQKARKITVENEEGKRIFTLSENELMILMLNVWEAGNMGGQTAHKILVLQSPFPQKIFRHFNGKFYRTA